MLMAAMKRDLKQSGPGYNDVSFYRDPIKGSNDGILKYDTEHDYYPSNSVLQGGGFCCKCYNWGILCPGIIILG